MGTNLAEMIERLSKGVEFSTTKDNYDLDYGSVMVPFGRVSHYYSIQFHSELVNSFFFSI